jgi:hypothetical protein
MFVYQSGLGRVQDGMASVSVGESHFLAAFHLLTGAAAACRTSHRATTPSQPALNAAELCQPSSVSKAAQHPTALSCLPQSLNSPDCRFHRRREPSTPPERICCCLVHAVHSTGQTCMPAAWAWNNGMGVVVKICMLMSLRKRG